MKTTLIWRRLPIAVATVLLTQATSATGSEASGAGTSPSNVNSAAAAASAASAAPAVASSASNGAATTTTTLAPECPPAEVVFKRVREAAKLNAAEASVIDVGVGSQAAEVVSNLLGFGGIFRAASGAAELSAHKKIADAIAADPCGDRALDAFPKSYRLLYDAYQKQLKKK